MRENSDDIRRKNRKCIDESELGRLYVEGLALLKTPVVRLAQIPPCSKSFGHAPSDKLRVSNTCIAAVYDVVLGSFDVIEQGHISLIPGALRDIYEWSLLLLAVIVDDSVAPKILSDSLDWDRDVLRAAKSGWPNHIRDLLRDWGALSGAVHHEKSISVTRYWPEGLYGSSLMLGANLDCRKTLQWMVKLCITFGNHLFILRNWDGLQNLSDKTEATNTDDAWREAIDSWRANFEEPDKFLP